MNNTEKLVLRQHFVTLSAASTVTVRLLPGLRWYAGPAPLLSARPLPRLCLLGGAKYRDITVAIMVAT